MNTSTDNPAERSGKRATEHPGFARMAVRFCAIALPAAALFAALPILLVRWGVFGPSARSFYDSSALLPSVLIAAPILAAIGAVLPAAWYVSGVISQKRSGLSKAVSNLQAGVGTIEKGKLTDPDDEPIYDQLSEISQQLYGLNTQNERLRSEYDQLNSKIGGLKFNLLTAKSSPAMVHRIIATIEQLAKDGKSEEIARLSANANAVLGSALTDSRQPVPLANELALIKKYLEINEQLSGKKIAYRMSIMCNIVNLRTIPQLILPVVANFCEYAERGTAFDNYEISVEVAMTHDRLVISIRDNGTGVSDENLESIRTELDDPDAGDAEDTISLSNINRRVRMHYGEQYGLKVTSSRLGTIVRIYLPEHMEDVEG